MKEHFCDNPECDLHKFEYTPVFIKAHNWYQKQIEARNFDYAHVTPEPLEDKKHIQSYAFLDKDGNTKHYCSMCANMLNIMDKENPKMIKYYKEIINEFDEKEARLKERIRHLESDISCIRMMYKGIQNQKGKK